ncbi:MAG TPA: potassium transporter TrkG [Opitutaceae bacterium]|nr:potassium transporter TrkG [Opitutaceae bacterium]
MPLTDQQRTRLVGQIRGIPLGFGALILVGAVLLWLPWMHRPGVALPPLDALFLSTSAVCVTGLATVNVAETFNFAGQFVLLGLIQLGGVGIMTAGTLFLILSGRRLSLADEHLIRNTVGGLRTVTPFAVFLHALGFVLVLELIGAAALYLLPAAGAVARSPADLWDAVFHSVSAFCNAGLSTFPEGLVRWRHEPWRLTVVGLLVVAGGIGLLALVNLRFYYFWRRDPRARGYLTVQARLSLVVAGILLVAGTVFAFLSEWNGAFSTGDLPARLGEAAFHSTMARTAGFNTVEVGAMSPATLLGTMALMFVGGAPGSMAGGIKTVTFALLVLAAWTALRRRAAIVLWGRSIPEKQASTAILFTLIAGTFLLGGTILLLVSEQNAPSGATNHHWLGLMFEAVSAFGTVGLSTGVTPLLTAAGKLIVVALMFGGRVGPLILALYLARPPAFSGVRYPPETLTLG